MTPCEKSSVSYARDLNPPSCSTARSVDVSVVSVI